MNALGIGLTLLAAASFVTCSPQADVSTKGSVRYAKFADVLSSLRAAQKPTLLNTWALW